MFAMAGTAAQFAEKHAPKAKDAVFTTARIYRAEVWQWSRPPRGVLNDGRQVTKELFRSVLDEELGKIKATVGTARFEKGKFAAARELFDKITTDDQFVEFLTLPGYDKLD